MVADTFEKAKAGLIKSQRMSNLTTTDDEGAKKKRRHKEDIGRYFSQASKAFIAKCLDAAVCCKC